MSLSRRVIAAIERVAASSPAKAAKTAKTAFVLSGGGNLGAVQVGMLKALDEAGVRPDLIIGCSVGAINGAGYAADPDASGVERLERIWNRLADGRPDLMPTSRLVPLVAQVARRGMALHDQDVLRDLVAEELDARLFSELKVDFACLAADLEWATEFWFDRGELIPALMASSALPAVYAPVEHWNRTYIDGGVLREVPVHRAVEQGATTIYILHVGHLGGRAAAIGRPFDAAIQAYWAARTYRLAEDLKAIPDHCTVHVLPAGCRPRLRFDDFSRARELTRYAYEASSTYLATGTSPSPESFPKVLPAPSRWSTVGTGADAEGVHGSGRDSGHHEPVPRVAAPEPTGNRHNDPVEWDVLNVLRESFSQQRATTSGLLQSYRPTKKDGLDVKRESQRRRAAGNRAESGTEPGGGSAEVSPDPTG